MSKVALANAVSLAGQKVTSGTCDMSECFHAGNHVILVAILRREVDSAYPSFVRLRIDCSTTYICRYCQAMYFQVKCIFRCQRARLTKITSTSSIIPLPRVHTQKSLRNDASISRQHQDCGPTACECIRMIQMRTGHGETIRIWPVRQLSVDSWMCDQKQT